MYIKLQEMIQTGYGTAELIIDSPHQFKEYSNYVVFELVKKTPMNEVASRVLTAIANEIAAELDNPSLYQRIENEIYRVVQSYRLRRQVKHNKSSNVLSFNKTLSGTSTGPKRSC